MAVATNWLKDLKGQELFVGGTELLPTKKVWNLKGVSAVHNTVTDQIDISIGGAGFDWQESVRGATTANLAATRVGNVLTADGNGALIVDGVTYAVGDRILVKDQSLGANNGIYVVSDIGSGSTPFVLTRDVLADETGEITPGMTAQVEEGATIGGQYWYVTNTGTITLNSTVITFALAIDPSAPSGGDVVGPAGVAATDALVRYDTATGKLIQDSLVLLSDTGDMTWDESAVSPTLSQTIASAGAGSDMAIIAQAAAVGSAANGADLNLTPGALDGAGAHGALNLQDGGGTDRLTINATGNLVMDAVTSYSLRTGGVERIFIDMNELSFGAAVSNPAIRQRDETAGVSSDVLLIHAQNNTFGGSTGGNLSIRPGTGTAAGGILRLQDGGGSVTRIQIAEDGVVTVAGPLFVDSFTATENYIDIDTGATALSAANHVRFRSNAGVFEVSENGGAYAAIAGFDPTNITDDMTWASTHATPTLSQATDVGADATGDQMTISAQGVGGGGTTITGGALLINAGDAAGGATNDIGGALAIRPGSGTTTNGVLTVEDGNGAARLTISAAGETTIDSASSLALGTATIARVAIASAAVTLVPSLLQFGAGTSLPVILQADDPAADATGDLMVLHAQDVGGGGTTITGGALNIRAGNASGAATNDIGGALDIRPGSGTTTDGVLTLSDGGGSARVTLNAAGNTTVDGATTTQLQTGGSDRIVLSSTQIQLVTPLAQFAASTALPIITHQDDTTSDATGDLFTLHSQDVTGGGTTITGGALDIRAGDASGAATNDIGGALDIRPGSGTTTDGVLTASDGGGTARLTINAAGNTTLDGAASVGLQTGGANRVVVAASTVTFNVNTVLFASTAFEPRIQQSGGTTGTGDPFEIQAQDMSGDDATGGVMDLHGGDVTGGGTTITGGAMTIRGGDASGAATNDIGGAMTVGSGTGTTNDGQLTLEVGGTPVITCLANGSVIELGPSNFQFDNLTAAPVFRHEVSGSATTGAGMTINSQDVTTVGTIIGGSLTIRAGDVTGAGTSNTGGAIAIRGGNATGATTTVGGNVTIRGGNGTEGDGNVQLLDGNGNVVVDVDATSLLGFYGTTPAARPTTYTRAATVVETRALLANASASAANNNAILAQLLEDLANVGLILVA